MNVPLATGHLPLLPATTFVKCAHADGIPLAWLLPERNRHGKARTHSTAIVAKDQCATSSAAEDERNPALWNGAPSAAARFGRTGALGSHGTVESITRGYDDAPRSLQEIALASCRADVLPTPSAF